MGNKGGFGKRLLGLLLYVVIGVAVVAAISGGQNWLHQHNGFLRQGDAPSLNEMRARGEDFPIGDFVSLEVKAVAGTYATNTSSTESHGASFQTGKDYYYGVILEDLTVMTIIASDQEDIRQLDALADAVENYSGSVSVFDDPSFPSYTVTGRLEELKNKEVLQYYDEAVALSGLNDPIFNVTTIALDASAMRTEKALLFIGAPIALVVLVIIIVSRRSKKKRQEEEEYRRRMAERDAAGL